MSTVAHFENPSDLVFFFLGDEIVEWIEMFVSGKETRSVVENASREGDFFRGSGKTSF